MTAMITLPPRATAPPPGPIAPRAPIPSRDCKGALLNSSTHATTAAPGAPCE